MNSIFESVNDAINNVNESLDELYYKQIMIMESADGIPDVSIYKCFQEGFLFPKSKAIKLYKFDNDHLLKAVKLFNSAYNSIPFDQYFPEYDTLKRTLERGDRTKLSSRSQIPKSLCDHIHAEFKNLNGDFQKAIIELGKQFSCSYDIDLEGGGTYTVPARMKFPENSDKKITLSKSKGFQLGNVRLKVSISIADLLNMCPADRNLFGQFTVGILLHETFHNIVAILDRLNKEIEKDVTETLDAVAKSKNVVTETTKCTSLVERIKRKLKVKDKLVDEKRMSTRFYILSQIKGDKNAINKFSKDVEKNNDPVTDKEIEAYIRELKKNSRAAGGNRIIGTVKDVLQSVFCIIAGGVGIISGQIAGGIAVGGVGLLLIYLMISNKKREGSAILGGMGTRLQEEYFCDLFAAMYQFPAHLMSYNRRIAINKLNSSKAEKMDKLEAEWHDKMDDIHPDTFDRELVSYRLAKQILASKKHLKKEVKDYLKYIVDLHDGIEDIKTTNTEFRNKRLSPEASADLQETLTEFTKKNNVAVTESFIEEFCGGEYYGS